jgi:drug/metabolite transporter (DMT)-like permease
MTEKLVFAKAGGGNRLDLATLGAFAVAVVIGGSNAVAVRFSNLELPPFWGAASRFAAAAIIFWLVIAIRRIRVPSGRWLAANVLYGSLSIGASYAFLYWALLRIQAGMAMVVLALGPLLTLALAVAHGLEPFRTRGLIGALTSLLGIGIAARLDTSSAAHLPSLLALVAGAACIAEGSVIYKLIPRSDPVVTNAVALTTGAAILGVTSIVARESWRLPTLPATWAAFAYLATFGSVVLFYLYLFVLSRWTASATSYSFLLFPIATTIVAAWLADEVVTLRFALGGAVVLAGVWLGAFSQRTKP